MPVFSFDPSKGMETVAKKVTELANEIESGINFEIGGFSPRVDIEEDDKGLYINVELPGMEKSQIKLSVSDDNVLTITGEKNKEEDDGSRSRIRTERRFGKFKRAFALPENIDRESIKAEFNNGILDVILDKKEPEKLKEYKVEIL